MLTIDQIEALLIIGTNAGSYQRIINHCNDFIVGDASISDKIRAIRKIDATMGIKDSGNISEKDVKEYLQFCTTHRDFSTC